MWYTYLKYRENRRIRVDWFDVYALAEYNVMGSCGIGVHNEVVFSSILTQKRNKYFKNIFIN